MAYSFLTWATVWAVNVALFGAAAVLLAWWYKRALNRQIEKSNEKFSRAGDDVINHWLNDRR